jgi:uncharacterized alkaline shock family protein YloU
LVISVVASIAVSEVEGVTGHFSELKNSNIEKISRKNLNRNLKIDVLNRAIYINLNAIFFNINF